MTSESRKYRATVRLRNEAASVVRWPGGSRVLLLLLVLGGLLACGDGILADRQQLAEPVISSKQGVCQSMDVRNNLKAFENLRGCRVIEGWLQILLMDLEEEDFKDLAFPELVEITGYMLLFRVNGLRSIGQLFPNLAVIRGHQLFVNYGFVAYEMMSLQEIGLHSLTDIIRGSVRIEKNPDLCYVDTIEWEAIAKESSGENVIEANKPRNECPFCEKDCPINKSKPDERLCWNKQYCQRVCSKDCENACGANGECCNANCLGGCGGPSEYNCTVCKHVIVGDRCVTSCPEGTYDYRSRRCVSRIECRTMKKPRENSNTRDYPYKPFRNKCIIDCPPGYMETEIQKKKGEDSEYTCTPCKGPCVKECPGIVIDSIAGAQSLQGCTIINGALEIAVRNGHNIVRELEENLSGIEVITGFLKIFRSYPLISLNFLRNLREIQGHKLAMREYSLVILDNPNLQELWNWTTHPKLTIGRNGTANNVKVSFHYNPKLCPQTIELLRKKTGLQEFTEIEVSQTTNGDKVPCNVTALKTEIGSISSKAAFLLWEPFEHYDPRILLGYTVYSREAPNQNISIYDSRDACGEDEWRVDDVKSEGEGKKDKIMFILGSLKPYTQYAFYVKTFTISTERSGGQSPILYFTTLPGQPSIVRNLRVFSNDSDTLVMSWLPPSDSNGKLTHYAILGQMEEYDTSYISQRNYCEEPILPVEDKSSTVIVEEERRKLQEEKALLEQQKNCKCQKKDPLQQEKEVTNSMKFEDALHNQVYIKGAPRSRRRRDLAASQMLEAVNEKLNSLSDQSGKEHVVKEDYRSSNTSTKLIEQPKDKMFRGSYTHFMRTVLSTERTYVMTNLRHFGKYTIKITACREPEANEQERACSSAAMITLKTLKKPGADDIPSHSFKVEKIKSNDSSIAIKAVWDEPLDPNGVIVAYQLEYKRVDFPNVKPVVTCVTGDKFKNDSFTYILPNLPPGNYSLRVRATSFAGNGAYTETKYVDIPRSNSHPTLGDYFIYAVVFFTVFIILGSLGYYALRKYIMLNNASMRLIATVNPEYVSTVYIPDEWEVARKKIQLLRELGNGSFGMVYEGIAKDLNKGQPELRCAIKTVNENASDRERIEFLNEASVMKGFNTHHVVRLLGVVSQGQPTLVVMELMVNGDLKTYLRSHRPDVCENFPKQPPTLKRILQMAIEIADGMAYLAAKKFVHRDLAARNCMVADDLTVKIGDFGMTRDIYETDYYRKGTKGLLPVRWMAPESLKDGVFTSYSDVWSYGVVLWEMVTLASQPYQGLSNDQVLKYVIEGGVMEGPENCPESLYNLMRQTWNHKASRRPTFLDIEGMLLSEINSDNFEKVSFYHSADGIEARSQNNSQFSQIENNSEFETLQELQEEDTEVEQNEDSPLRQDFDMVAFTETPQAQHDGLNIDPFPTHTASLDEFDGLSAGSFASSKDTLDLPFAEEGLNSVKASPYTRKKSSRGNISQVSSCSSSATGTPLASAPGRASVSPQIDCERPVFLDNGSREEPDYENRSPEILVMNEIHSNASDDQKGSPKVSVSPVNVADNNEGFLEVVVTTSPEPSSPTISSGRLDSKSQQKPIKLPPNVNAKSEHQRLPTLNNGYISSTST